MASSPTKITGRVIIAGPVSVGKTCLIERFVNNIFDEDECISTVGVDCYEKSVYVENNEVKLFLYDTAGQERFAEMTSSYYRKGDVCLLCFDLSADIDASLNSMDSWRRKILDSASKVTFIMVGTKEDLLLEPRKADVQTVLDWAEEKGMPYFPTSALQGGDHINFLFNAVAEKCIRLHREKELESLTQRERRGVKLQSAFGRPQKSKLESCCER
mmetsp:Transcript_22032/g.38808  ORF Transcript_22032/g.38808 Transcript_22032/m.38808 type:complete len:215 (+) Transcript_22032:22-666(+)